MNNQRKTWASLICFKSVKYLFTRNRTSVFYHFCFKFSLILLLWPGIVEKTNQSWPRCSCFNHCSAVLSFAWYFVGILHEEIRASVGMWGRSLFGCRSICATVWIFNKNLNVEAWDIFVCWKKINIFLISNCWNWYLWIQIVACFFLWWWKLNLLHVFRLKQVNLFKH